jgi:hypothetical protein
VASFDPFADATAGYRAGNVEVATKDVSVPSANDLLTGYSQDAAMAGPHRTNVIGWAGVDGGGAAQYSSLAESGPSAEQLLGGYSQDAAMTSPHRTNVIGWAGVDGGGAAGYSALAGSGPAGGASLA